MDIEIMRMKVRKEVEMSHKQETDEYGAKLISVENDWDEMKWNYEILKVEFDNLKIEIDKERIVNK